MVNYMREHMPQDARIDYIITNGGAAPNIVPDFAKSFYVVRHPDPRVTGELFARVVKAAEGAALGTETKMDYELINGTYSTLPNDVLGRVMDANLRRVGAPNWTPAEKLFAERLQKNLPGRSLPALASAGEIRKYQYNGQKYSSTNSGDVSWVTPLVTLNTATGCRERRRTAGRPSPPAAPASAPRRWWSRRRRLHSPARSSSTTPNCCRRQGRVRQQPRPGLRL